jgi:LytS/YehU family sensor histidine kinase
LATRGFWRAQVIGWGLFTLVDLIDRELTYHSLPTSLLLTLLVAPCCVGLSTAMRDAFERFSPSNDLTVRTLALITGLALAAAVVTVAWLAVVQRLAGLVPGATMAEIVVPLIHYFLAFVGWCLFYFWIRAEVGEHAEHRHALAAEAEALRAELEEMRLQLDPHFLFNALNGIAEEIPEHPSAALAMLRDLNAYLRHSLAGIKQTVVAVAAEADAVAAYLRVQRARFGTRLATTMTVAPDAADCRIASFLLQPLVENAVKHGTREPAIELGIAIQRNGDALDIEIANTGTLAGARRPRNRAAIGLDNVRRRLALHYPDRHRFALVEREGRVVASLTLRGEPCGS